MAKLRNQYRSSAFSKPLKMYCTLIVVLVTLTLFYFIWKHPNKIYIAKLQKQRDSVSNEYAQKDFNVKSVAPVAERIVHLDLKGAPPKISYYKKLFPLLSELGATGVLIEYEDMFPYVGELQNISALNAYTLEDVKKMTSLARESNLKVIPLVQTFGHMEFMLKLIDYKVYREVPTYPQVICPTHENTLNLLTSMIEQVVMAHPTSQMIHIGADEVYYLGMCDRCTDAMLKYNLSKNMLFMEHINSIVGIINKKFPNLRVLMWDDQFRSMTPKELRMGHLNKNIEPVVWKYTKDVYEELGPTLWEGYSQIFTKIWVASAFKGATGSNQIVSDVTHYLQNHRSWLSVIAEYKTRVSFQGVFITGWQRYDHFAVLCELLPVGIPTLAMSLRLLLGYNDSPLSPPTEVAKILLCKQPYALIGPVFGSPQCAYSGGNILEHVLRLQQLKQEYDTFLEDSRVQGWLSDYNIAHAFSNPKYVESVTSSLSRIYSELAQVDSDIAESMFEIYDNYTINEWRETYIKPFERKVYAMLDARNTILARNTWPRRPLKHDEV